MIDQIKDILGLSVSDYDLYIAIICTTGLLWCVKSVITGVFNTVLHIFR